MAATSNKLNLEDKIKFLNEDGIDLENKIIYLWGELEENLGTTLRVKSSVLRLFWEAEKKQSLTEISLDISSYGGSIYSIYGAIDFYDELKSEGILVNTKAQGICMSAATILLSGGTGVRSATKRCKFMLHDIQTDGGIGGTATQVKEYAKTLDKEQKELFRFYVEFSKNKSSKKKMSEKELEDETKKWMTKYATNSVDHYISAQQAKDLRLIDKII